MKINLLCFIITLLLYTSSCKTNFNAGKQAVNQCDTATLNFDNLDNDTNMVVFIRGAVFDTIACLSNIEVVDRKNNATIKNAQVSFANKNYKYSGSTNSNGIFEVFKTGLCSFDNYDLMISHKDYKCMKLTYNQLYGGVWIKIKLNHK